MDARNDLKAAVPKLCLALEAARRTDEGVRVRTSHEFLAHYFPHDQQSATDRLFVHLPKSVRGPILSSWGIRGKKAALTDSDSKVLSVVHDALLAGDIDHAAIEQAITPELLVKHAPLAEWWGFWRGGKMSKRAILLLLTTAAEVGEIDPPWFWGAIKVGELSGTDALAHFMSRDDLARWIKTIHQTGDGSAKGLFGALGWPFIVEKTDDASLLAVVDALAAKMGLLASTPPAPTPEKSPVAVTPAAPPVAPAAPPAPPPTPSEPKPAEAKSAPAAMTRKPEPAKPPEPSLRRSQRPPMIPIDIDEPTSEGTDEYPLAEADALKRLTKT